MSLISHCLDLIGAFVAVYVITTGYYFISKILCCTIMVVIQCPHCSLSVELDDGVSGLFDCPHCGEDFQWGEIDEEIDHKTNWVRLGNVKSPPVCWNCVCSGDRFVVLSSHPRVVITSPFRRIFCLHDDIKPNLRRESAKTKVDLHSKRDSKWY